MVQSSKFDASPHQFVKDNTTDLVNLVLGWAVFWCYGFRTVLWCGYTGTQTVSKWYCDQFLQELQESTGCFGVGASPSDSPDVWTQECEDEWRNIPKFADKYSEGLYETCTGRVSSGRFNDFGSIGLNGGFCSGVYGSGEFVVTLMLMLLTTIVFFWKMAKYVHCPDKLERKRRKEYMLKQHLLTQNSKAS